MDLVGNIEELQSASSYLNLRNWVRKVGCWGLGLGIVVLMLSLESNNTLLHGPIGIALGIAAIVAGGLAFLTCTDTFAVGIIILYACAGILQIARCVLEPKLNIGLILSATILISWTYSFYVRYSIFAKAKKFWKAKPTKETLVSLEKLRKDILSSMMTDDPRVIELRTQRRQWYGWLMDGVVALAAVESNSLIISKKDQVEIISVGPSKEADYINVSAKVGGSKFSGTMHTAFLLRYEFWKSSQ